MSRPKHQQSQDRLSFEELDDSFPYHQYPEMRPNQEEALLAIAEEDGNTTAEAPTGTGKSAVAYAFAETLRRRRLGPIFIIMPNKAQVEQFQKLHPPPPYPPRHPVHHCLQIIKEKVKHQWHIKYLHSHEP